MTDDLCQGCGRDWFAACICPGTDADEAEAELAQLTQGICPRSGARIMPGGILRPACAICDCGEAR